MATQTKDKKQTAQTPREFEEDRADASALSTASKTVPGVQLRGGTVTLDTAPREFGDDLEQVDPQAIKTKAEEMVGKDLVVFAWTIRPGSDKYKDENGEIHDYAVLGFYFQDDSERRARFLTTGGARIVPAIAAAIAQNVALPVITRLVSYQAKKGTGYRFERKEERAKRIANG